MVSISFKLVSEVSFFGKDLVFSYYARFILTEFPITRIFQRERRSYQKQKQKWNLHHNVRFDILCELGDSKELKFLGGEASGKGAWKWFQSGFKQFQAP